MNDEFKANRYGHRARMRLQFIHSGDAGMSDTHLLELFLGQAILQKDVKATVYALINKYGNIENIFNADYDDLRKTNNIGDNVAMIIVMAREIMSNAYQSKSQTSLKSKAKREDYILNELPKNEGEGVVLFALNNNGEICAKKVINNANGFDATFRETLFSLLLSSNASNCIIINYCPNKQEQIETKIYFYSLIKNALNTIGMGLTDAGIYNKNGLALLSNTSYNAMLQ